MFPTRCLARARGTTANDATLFFDNLVPVRLGSLLTAAWRTPTSEDLPDLARYDRLVKRTIPPEMHVTDIVPRLQDGGAFVTLRHEPGLDPRDIESRLKPLKPWFNPFRAIRAKLVRGTPWHEDLSHFPTSLIKIEFLPSVEDQKEAPTELRKETLYNLFRPYGKIAQIMLQPADSKVTPRYAEVLFKLRSDAIMARNCMHNYVVDAPPPTEPTARSSAAASASAGSESTGNGDRPNHGTRFEISYVKRVKANSIWDWLTKHPRIVIPIVAAFLAGASVMIFDPIRQFFIKLHITHSLSFTKSRAWKWFKSQTENFPFTSSRDPQDGLDTVWNHRRDLIEQLRDWVTQNSDTFIVITGPKGSGKSEMVMDQALAHRKNVLHIDCKPIVEARGETITIRRLAAAVGYRPVFSWASGVSSMVDLAVQSNTGVKAGFSETLDTQLSKILHTTTAALRQVALEGRTKNDSDVALSEDAYLEAHPERRPVVVVDNFVHKGEDYALVNDKLAEWAASVVQNNVAHVIFLTNDASLKPLTKALPDRVFRSVSLGDLEPSVATSFVLNRLRQERKNAGDRDGKQEDKDEDAASQPVKAPSLEGLESATKTLGGRLTDLEFLTRRLMTGQSPEEAIEEIVDESATDISKIFLFGAPGGDSGKPYSTQQAWHLIRSLAASPTLRYQELLLSPTFSSSLSPSAANGEAAIEALTSAGLIAVTYHQGCPETIRAGKPLYQAAFRLLQQNKVLRASMDLAVVKEQLAVEKKAFKEMEAELGMLRALQTRETDQRAATLLGSYRSSMEKMEGLGREKAALEKILKKKP